MMRQDALNHFRKILGEVESISDLDGLWSAFLSTLRVFASAVSADQLHPWVRQQPPCQRLRRSIRDYEG